MALPGYVRSIAFSCVIAFSAGVIAAEATPSVGIEFTATGVTIEGRTYTSADVTALRTKLDEIRLRVPKPDLSLSIADGVTEVQTDSGMKLLFDAGFERDIEEHTR